MYLRGGLLPALAIWHRENTKTALLVIDEHEDAIGGEPVVTTNPLIPAHQESVDRYVRRPSITNHQQRLIMYMQNVGAPVFLIEYGNNSHGPLRVELTGLYSGKVIRVKKPDFNAFWKTHLDSQLKQLGVTHLVISGWNANVCVAATVGIPVNYLGLNPFYYTFNGPGAIDLGYKVLTCHDVLHGNGHCARWDNYASQKIFFYENLETARTIRIGQ